MFQRNTISLKVLGHCKRSPETMMVPLKCIAACVPLCYIVYKQFMAVTALPKNNVSIEKWMAATKETKKHCTLKIALPCD